MKNKIITLLLIASLALSCNKESRYEHPQWNCLSFTNNNFPEYSKHMNDPHISFTFPTEISAEEINYKNGHWKHGTMVYVLTAHNWGTQEVLFTVYRNGTIVHEQTLMPSQDKGLSLSFIPEEGEYTFTASVKENGGLTLLHRHPLFNSREAMIVK